jgi:hypothetical protein
MVALRTDQIHTVAPVRAESHVSALSDAMRTKWMGPVLRAIDAAFTTTAAAEMPTQDLLQALVAQGDPWRLWWSDQLADIRELPGVANRLAFFVRPSGLAPRMLLDLAGHKKARGYRYQDVQAALARCGNGTLR